MAGNDLSLYTATTDGGDTSAERITIKNTTGYVGIGTTAPGASLGVSGGIQVDADSNGFLTLGRFSVAAPDAYIQVPTGGLIIRTDGVGGGNNRMIVDASGNVGIGTTLPVDKLTIVQAGAAETGVLAGQAIGLSVFNNTATYIAARDTDNDIEFAFGTSGSNYTFAGAMTNHALGLRTNNTDRIYIADTGNVGIGTTIPSTNLHVVGGLRVTDLASCNTIDTDENGVMSCGTDDGSAVNGWTDAGTNVYLTTATDKVGIGTTGPNYNLHVNGTFNATSVYSNGVLLTPGTGSNWSVYGANIARTSGNVGIGITSPTVKFHIVGSNNMATFENTSTTANTYSQLVLKAGTASNSIWTANQNSTSWGGANSLNIYAGTGGAMTLWTNATEKVRIT
ncbi:MAG: hypothetical protein Q7T74_05505, partial [Candidatus Saccharibacteria bacterium]|nr:hypothetical protein [Candidatus Saccharibacteria bacterium]